VAGPGVTDENTASPPLPPLLVRMVAGGHFCLTRALRRAQFLDNKEEHSRSNHRFEPLTVMPPPRPFPTGVPLPGAAACPVTLAIENIIAPGLLADRSASLRAFVAQHGLGFVHSVDESVSGATPATDDMREVVLARRADERAADVIVDAVDSASISQALCLCTETKTSATAVAAWLAARVVPATFAAGRVFGMRRTRGSAVECIPPPAAVLCGAFLACHECVVRRRKAGKTDDASLQHREQHHTPGAPSAATTATTPHPLDHWPPSEAWIEAAARCAACGGRETLTVGARALSKHAVRDGSQSFWGAVPRGPKSVQNRRAVAILVEQCEWRNAHRLPGAVAVFEIRVARGYGARWRIDGTEFRGFLEPAMADGWASRWRHHGGEGST
jgi:hypothetical protein